MFRALFVKEILETLASRRLWVVLALCFVLVPLGVEAGLRGQQTRLQNYRQSMRIYQEETRLVQDVLNKEGAKAFAPPAPMSFLSLGLELVLPNVAETPAGRIQPPVVMHLSANQGRDNLYEFFTGSLDLAFIVAVVMSLLAVILTYDAVAGEKERGTLGQVLSNAVPRADILLAKASASALVLIVPFLLALGLSLAVMQIQGHPLPAGAEISLGFAVFLSVLLMGVFLSLGLFVSSLARQSVPALVALLLLWVFFFGVYPRLAAAAAQIIYPVKSDAQVALEKSRIKQDVEKERDAEIEIAARDTPEDFRSEAFQAGRKKQQEIRDRYQARLEGAWRAIDRDVETRRDSRNALTANIARVSPVSSFIRPMAELGRTGWLEHKRFRDLVRRYEEVLNREIFNKLRIIRMASAVTVSNEADPKAPAPVFAYVPLKEDAVVRNVLPDVLLLLLFNLVFFAGAFAAFLRFDPR